MNCPVCGQMIEWCTGHTLWSDPYGWLIQRMHDHDIHTKCVPMVCVPEGIA